MSKHIGIIYCLKCPNSNEIRYIGQTIKSLELRLKQHLWYSIKQNNHLGYWLKSLNKKPLIEKIEECNFQLLNEKEIYWINYYKNNKLVNSMKGCELSKHHTHSEESKRKIGIKSTMRQLGVKKSEQCKLNISKAHKGKKLSKETIAKMLESRKNYKITEETKEKISLSNKGKIRTEEAKIKMSNSSKKDLYVYNITDKQITKTCIKDFAKSLNLYPNSISDRLTKYADKIYRSNYLLSREKEELKKIMQQLNIK